MVGLTVWVGLSLRHAARANRRVQALQSLADASKSSKPRSEEC
jgi:hypothetical protein